MKVLEVCIKTYKPNQPTKGNKTEFILKLFALPTFLQQNFCKVAG